MADAGLRDITIDRMLFGIAVIHRGLA